MNRRTAKLLFDAMTVCAEFEELIEKPTYEEYLQDRTTQLVTERLLHILGEALHHATVSDPYLFEVTPNAAQIIGMRNVIAHGYTELHQDKIWNAAVNEVPALCPIFGLLLENYEACR